MSCGTGEMIVVAFVLIVIFSASRMGSLGNALGKFIYSFKKASSGDDLIDAKRPPSGKIARRVSPEDAQLVDDKKPRT